MCDTIGIEPGLLPDWPEGFTVDDLQGLADLGYRIDAPADDQRYCLCGIDIAVVLEAAGVRWREDDDCWDAAIITVAPQGAPTRLAGVPDGCVCTWESSPSGHLRIKRSEFTCPARPHLWLAGRT